jgi:hypothetical protein
MTPNREPKNTMKSSVVRKVPEFSIRLQFAEQPRGKERIEGA